MATALARQVAQLREGRRRKGEASILFTRLEAESYNLDAVHEIGLNGLSELCGLNPAFYEFQGNLFARSALGKDRELFDASQVKSTNDNLSRFLHLVSPFFATRPAQKALEFLIRHYKIHIHNVDELIGCALPSHETRFFARVANLAPLKDTMWQFMSRISRTGSPLPRAVLALQCVKDIALYHFILGMVTSGDPHRSTVSFVAATARDALARASAEQAERLLDATARAVTSTAVSDSADVRSFALVLLASASSSALLAQRVLARLLAAWLEAARRTGPGEGSQVECAAALVSALSVQDSLRARRRRRTGGAGALSHAAMGGWAAATGAGAASGDGVIPPALPSGQGSKGSGSGAASGAGAAVPLKSTDAAEYCGSQGRFAGRAGSLPWLGSALAALADSADASAAVRHIVGDAVQGVGEEGGAEGLRRAVAAVRGVRVSHSVSAELVGLVVGTAFRLTGAGADPAGSQVLGALGAALAGLSLGSAVGAEAALQLVMRLAGGRSGDAPSALLDWMQGALEGSPLAPLRAGVQAMASPDGAAGGLDVTTLPFALGSSSADVRLEALGRVAAMVDSIVEVRGGKQVGGGSAAAMTDSDDDGDDEAAEARISFVRGAVAARQFDENAEVARRAVLLEARMVASGLGFAADMAEGGETIWQRDLVLEGTPAAAVSRYSKLEQLWSSLATSRASGGEEVGGANGVVVACLRAAATAAAQEASDDGVRGRAALLLLKHSPVAEEGVSVVDAEAINQMALLGRVFAPLRGMARLIKGGAKTVSSSAESSKTPSVIEDAASGIVSALARAASSTESSAPTVSILAKMMQSKSPRLMWLGAASFVESMRRAGAAAHAMAGAAGSVMWPVPIDDDEPASKGAGRGKRRRRSRSASMSSVASDGAKEAEEAAGDARSAGGIDATAVAAGVALACSSEFARLVSARLEDRVSAKVDYLAVADLQLGLPPHDGPSDAGKHGTGDAITARSALAVQGLLTATRLLESCVRWSAAAACDEKGDVVAEVTRRVVLAVSGGLSPETSGLDAAAAAYAKCIGFGLQCIGRRGAGTDSLGKDRELVSVGSLVGTSLCLKSSMTVLADGALTALPPFPALLATLVVPRSRSDPATEAALHVLCVYAIEALGQLRSATQHSEGLKCVLEFVDRYRSCMAPLLLMGAVCSSNSSEGVRRAAVRLLGAASRLHKGLSRIGNDTQIEKAGVAGHTALASAHALEAAVPALEAQVVTLFCGTNSTGSSSDVSGARAAALARAGGFATNLGWLGKSIAAKFADQVAQAASALPACVAELCSTVQLQQRGRCSVALAHAARGLLASAPGAALAMLKVALACAAPVGFGGPDYDQQYAGVAVGACGLALLRPMVGICAAVVQEASVVGAVSEDSLGLLHLSLAAIRAASRVAVEGDVSEQLRSLGTRALLFAATVCPPEAVVFESPADQRRSQRVEGVIEQGTATAKQLRGSRCDAAVLRSLASVEALEALRVAKAFAAQGQDACRQVAEARVGPGRRVPLLAGIVASLPAASMAGASAPLAAAASSSSESSDDGLVAGMDGSRAMESYPLVMPLDGTVQEEGEAFSCMDEVVQRLLFVSIRGPDKCTRAATSGLRRCGAGARSMGKAMAAYGIARAGDGAAAMLSGPAATSSPDASAKAYLHSASSVLSAVVACLESRSAAKAEGTWDLILPQVQGVLVRALFHSQASSEREKGLRARFPTLGDREASLLLRTSARTAQSIGDAQHVALLALTVLYRISQQMTSALDACSAIDVSLAEAWAHDPSPSLQRAALLLLSAYARLRPVEVLDRLLAVFAELAIDNLGQDDPLGFALAQKMLAHVLPAVVAHGAEAGVTASHVIRLFSSLSGVVPTHRRQLLFASLLESLGVAEKERDSAKPATSETEAPPSPDGSEEDDQVDVDGMLDGKAKYAGAAAALLVAGYVTRQDSSASMRRSGWRAPTPQDSGREALSYVEDDTSEADEHIMFGKVQVRVVGSREGAAGLFMGPPRVVPRTLAALGSDLYDDQGTLAQAVFLAGADSAVTARLPSTLELCRSLLGRSSAERQVLQLSQLIGIASAVMDDSHQRATGGGARDQKGMEDDAEDSPAEADKLGPVSRECVLALRSCIPTGRFAARLATGSKAGSASGAAGDQAILADDGASARAMFESPSEPQLLALGLSLTRFAAAHLSTPQFLSQCAAKGRAGGRQGEALQEAFLLLCQATFRLLRRQAVGQEEAERGLRFARSRGKEAVGDVSPSSSSSAAALAIVSDDLEGDEELSERYELAAAVDTCRSAEESVAFVRVHAWREAGEAAFAALSKIGQLLSVGAFAAVVSELLHHEDPVVRRRSIAMFNAHVSAKADQLSRAESQLYLHLLEDLLPMVRDRGESQETRQTALLAVEVLARNFASDFPVAFRPALEAAAETVDASAARVGDELRAAACVCVQAMAGHMGTMVIGHLSRVVPALLSAAERSLPSAGDASDGGGSSSGEDEDEENAGRALLLRCSLGAVAVALDKFPQFMPAYLVRLQAVACHPAVVSPPAGAIDLAFGEEIADAVLAGSSGSGLQGQLLKDVRARRALAGIQQRLQESMARLVPSRALLPAMLQSLETLRAAAPVSICGSLFALEAALEHGRRVEISGMAARLCDGLLQVLDYRWKTGGAEGSRASTLVERQVGRALGALFLRVSGERAQLLVNQLLDWGVAATEDLLQTAKSGAEALLAAQSRRTAMYTVLGAVMRAGQDALVDVMGDAFEAVCADLQGAFQANSADGSAVEAASGGGALAGAKRGRSASSDEDNSDDEGRQIKKRRADGSSSGDSEDSSSDDDSDSDSEEDDAEDAGASSSVPDAHSRFQGYLASTQEASASARAAAAALETKDGSEASHAVVDGVLVPDVSRGSSGIPTSRHGMRCAGLAFLQHFLRYDSLKWVAGTKSRVSAIVRSIGGAWAPLSARQRGLGPVLAASAKDVALPIAVGGGRAGLTRYGQTYIVPIMSALVRCLSGDLQWKQINLMALEHAHDERPEVRELAMQCSQVVFDEAGTDDVMVLIPETLPFVAEALEDEDAAVEESARALFKRLEELSDEDLEDFIKGT